MERASKTPSSYLYDQ
ncbi:TPA: hypothetical protein ACQ7ZA_002447 [Escherichia coli]